MRWWWLVWLMLLGAVAPVHAATLSTTLSGDAFGSVHVGAAGALTHEITVKNTDTTGTLNFTVASNLADFTVTPASGSLAPGQETEITISFMPSLRGARAATITVATPNDAANADDTFAVSGTGTSGNLTVSVTSLDFGTVAIAGATATRVITVSNPVPANEPLTFTLTTTGDYSVPATVDVVLAIGASSMITVTFDPTTSGTRLGTATIASDDSFNPSDAVSLTGIGQGAVFTVTPTSLDLMTVAVGQFAEETLTITNTGNQSGSVSAIASGNAVYTVTPVGAALPRVLAPAEELVVTVRFTPVDGSIVATNLSVTTTGTPASFQVPVTGDGLYEAITIVATDEPDLMISLGNRRVGQTVTKAITVTNTGETIVTLAAPTSSATTCVIGPGTPTLPAALDPTESATFSIAVTPTAVGAGACTITVTTDIPTTDTIELDWQGVAPEVALTSPATPAINFGVVDVDAAQAIRTVVLDNTGGAPLAIGPCTVTGSTRFSVVTSCTNLVVAPNTSATLMVAFDPALEAAEAGTLTIGVDALSVSEVTIALSGVGADQRLDLSALAVSFPDTSISRVDPPIEYIDIYNPVNPATGVAETLHISMATSDNGAFQLSNEGPFSVEANEMIRIAITFRPSAAGVYDGTLTIVSDASGLPMAAIALHGRGVIGSGDEAGGCCDTGAPGRSSVLLALGVVTLVLRRRRVRR